MFHTYAETQTLLTCHCDFTGSWRPSAILETMQETSGRHSDLLGVGRDALRREGVTWIVTRYELVMEKYPKIGDKVLTETYPLATRHGFYPRYFSFRSEAGEELGYASSLWALLRLEDRSMIPGNYLGEKIPDNGDLRPKIVMPRMASVLPGEARTAFLLPQYADLDDNRHVNNTKYLDWLCNALGIETMERRRVSRLLVAYHKEIRPGQQIRTELSRRDDAFSFCGMEGEERHFTLSGELKPEINA